MISTTVMVMVISDDVVVTLQRCRRIELSGYKDLYQKRYSGTPVHDHCFMASLTLDFSVSVVRRARCFVGRRVE